MFQVYQLRAVYGDDDPKDQSHSCRLDGILSRWKMFLLLLLLHSFKGLFVLLTKLTIKITGKIDAFVEHSLSSSAV
jgi:hypothetical protein